jgi:hypothetical protein
MATGAARELAAGGRLAADRGRDFLEAEAEHVMKQEGSALQRDRRSSAISKGKVTSSISSSADSTTGSGSHGPTSLLQPRGFI